LAARKALHTVSGRLNDVIFQQLSCPASPKVIVFFQPTQCCRDNFPALLIQSRPEPEPISTSSDQGVAAAGIAHNRVDAQEGDREQQVVTGVSLRSNHRC